jgi:copper chaperone
MVVLNVEGMSCQGCVRSVTNALTKLDPAAQVEVSLQDGTVAVTSTRQRAELAAAIEAAGFDVRPS